MLISIKHARRGNVSIDTKKTIEMRLPDFFISSTFHRFRDLRVFVIHPQRLPFFQLAEEL